MRPCGDWRKWGWPVGPCSGSGVGSAALPGDRPWAGLAAVGGVGLDRHPAAGDRLVPLARPEGGSGSSPLACPGRPAGAGGPWAGRAALAASRGGDGQGERLLVLQTAIPTRRKFEAIEQGRLLRQLASAQRAGAPPRWGRTPWPAPESPASLVLPEGSLPLGQPLPEPAGLEVLSGGFRMQGEETRSSLLRFAPGDRLATSWVDKHRLVPLGEWVPMARLWRWGGPVGRGGRRTWRALPAAAPSRRSDIGVAICYELSDGAALADGHPPGRDLAAGQRQSGSLSPHAAEPVSWRSPGCGRSRPAAGW